MDDKSILVSTEIENHAVIGDEIDRRAELRLHIRRSDPDRRRNARLPVPDRGFRLRVLLPELTQRAARDNLHEEIK